MTIIRSRRSMQECDRQQVLEMVRSGMSDMQIARATTWSSWTVYMLRRQHRISRADRSTPIIPEGERQRMREMRAAGVPVAVIAVETRRGESTIRRITRDCAPPRVRTKPAPRPEPGEEAPVIIPPTTEDRWREALAGRQFRDAIAFDAGKGKVGRVVVETGLGRSSMAWTA